MTRERKGDTVDFLPPPPTPPSPPDDGGPAHSIVVAAHAEQVSEHAAHESLSPHCDPCDISSVQVGGPSAIAIVLPYQFQPEAEPDVTTSSS